MSDWMRDSTGALTGIDRREFAAFQERQLRWSRLFWLGVVTTAVTSGLAIGMLWSFAAGFLIAATLAVAAYDTHKRWNRRRWLKRFPQLHHHHFDWTKQSSGSRI